jgi:5-methyltetrahydropteroyltriglutamate--homocysteine methyltransferase
MKAAPTNMLLSLGVIDGRNVWRTDLNALLELLEPIASTRDIILAPSCSLLHVPFDLMLESKIDDELRQWLAFAVQKVDELNLLKRALSEGRGSVADALAQSSEAAANRRTSARIHDSVVKARAASVTSAMRERVPTTLIAPTSRPKI